MNRKHGSNRWTRGGILSALLVGAALLASTSSGGVRTPAPGGKAASRAHGPTLIVLHRGKASARHASRLRAPALVPDFQIRTASPFFVTLHAVAPLAAAAPPAPPPPTTPAPAPSVSFAGLECRSVYFNPTTPCGHFPPDVNGEAGPEYYVQAIDWSYGIFTKAGGFVSKVRADTLFAGGGTGTACDTYVSNQRSPSVLYDTATDRWLLMASATTHTVVDGVNHFDAPFFECIAVSRTGVPTSNPSDWFFYSLEVPDLLVDNPMFGLWPDGLYMTGNAFPSGGLLTNARVYAINKSELEAGAATVHAQFFNLPHDIDDEVQWQAVPSTYRVATGIPPVGRANLITIPGGGAIGQTNKRVARIWKFHVDWTTPASSTLTGPTAVKEANWSEPPYTVPAKNGNALLTQGHRAMPPAQYVNLGGTESLWITHAVANPGNSALAAPRWMQVNVTGGTIPSGAVQESTWAPDSTVARWIPSLALDRLGDMALGYSASSSIVFPGIRYAGRLSTNPLGTLGLTEQVLADGTASQSGNYGSGVNNRWGDRSGMALDPNGCDFWYTDEYYLAETGNNWQTRVGSFRLTNSCTPAKYDTVVTASPASGAAGGMVDLTATLKRGTVPLAGKTVTFKLLGTTVGSIATGVDGVASLTVSLGAIGVGSYPTGVTATFAGDTAYNTSTASGSLTVS